jgi:lycopene cyclase CruA
MPDGDSALQAVAALERNWVALNTGARRPEPFAYVPTPAGLPSCPPENTFDVIVAGGSLGLIAGLALAQHGLRVMLFDRDRVGAAHREWNISERELAALQTWGIFTRDELSSIIATRYTRGLIAFDSQGTGVPSCPLTTHGVLDVALDAQSVLDLARSRFLQAGGTILEGRAFKKLHLSRCAPPSYKGPQSAIELDTPSGVQTYAARLVIDTMGSVSPIAVNLNDGLPFDGVCPTAGTVLEDLPGDPATGDVLVSVAPMQGKRQLIWEAFPGKQGETTVYLFYYDRTGVKSARNQSLLALFERYFTLLPTYQRQPSAGPPQPPPRHLKPVFGYIPARHGRTGRIAARGLICLGDSAAGQSPLTFCGFGSFVRHIGRVSYLLHYALRHDLLDEKHLRAISPHQANLRVAWVFSRFMQPQLGDPFSVNRLMNIFSRALDSVGPATTTRFLQDRYSFREYLRIMLTTARLHPAVVPFTARVLGPSGLAAWATDIAYFAGDSAFHVLLNSIGLARWLKLEHLARNLSPALALRLMSMRTAWRASS